MIWPAIIGALGALGSAGIGASSQNKRSRGTAFRPTTLTTNFGRLTTTGDRNRLNTNYMPNIYRQQIQQLGNQLSIGGLEGILSGDLGPGGQFGVGGIYDPSIINALNSPGMFTDPFQGRNPALGSDIGTLGLLSSLNNFNAGAPTSNLNLQTAGAGAGLLSRVPGLLDADYRDIAAQQTGLLRQGALPKNERLVANALDRLNSRGQLAISGARDPVLNNLQESLDSQDLGFQLAGLDRADALRNADRQLGLGLGDIGGGLLQGGEGLALQQNLGNIDAIIRGQATGGANFANILSALSGAQGTAGDLINTRNRDLTEALLGAGEFGLDAATTGAGLQQQDFTNALARLTAGETISKANLDAFLSMLTGSTALSSAAAGAGANAARVLGPGGAEAGLNALAGFAQAGAFDKLFQRGGRD